MRVAHIVGKLKAAGVEAVVFTYLRFMDRSGMEIDVLYDADSTVAPPSDLVDAGINFIEIPPYQKLSSYIKEVKRICLERQYDIVHSHMNALSVFPLYAAKHAGVAHRICHNHSTSSKVEKKRDAVKALLKPFCRRYATDYAACSELSAKWMYGEKICSAGAVKVFNNAIDTEAYKFDPEARERIRDDLGAGDKFVVGHIGRFVTQKNHSFLIDIFASVHRMRPDSVLLLIGEGEDKDAIREKVSSLGLSDSVIFKGVVSGAGKYYSAMDVFVLPSLYEGLPVVALEAQAAGLPCFISTEVTTECRVTAHVEFIPLTDGAESWGKIIAATTSNDRESDCEAVRESKFNILRSASDMRAYYDEILGEGGKR